MKLTVLFTWLLLPLAYGSVVTEGFQERGEVEVERETVIDGETVAPLDSCTSALKGLKLDEDKSNNIFDKVSFMVHRNGEGDPCGMAPSSIEAMYKALSSMEKCGGKSLNKFQVESFLTRLLSDLLASDACGSTDDDESPQGLLGFCDMGPDRTPVLTDHDQLIPVPSGSLPCRFFTREGVRITSLEQLKELALQSKEATEDCTAGEESCAAANALHLYAVPAGRMFMLAPKYVGETFEISHVAGREGQPISIEVMNLEPRVFEIYNFFSKEEADELIAKALAETSETHKLHRSTTGTKGATYSKRTSENAWDTHGKTAQLIKKRCMTTLGFDEYIEGHTDGLQILRYNTSTAYIPHMDYLDDRKVDSYNYDSAGKGGNRFATILLYMSDLGEQDGGETVFTEAWPPGVDEKDRFSDSDAVRVLRESGDSKLLAEGSWEEEMAAKCRTRLSVRPQHARAVLFYSQHPNGEEDMKSRHGGCPVLNPDAQKWAANLWVFSAPRLGFDGAPLKPGHETEETQFKQLKANFRNSGEDPAFDNAELFYDESGNFGKLVPKGSSINVNTYKGHVWNVMVDGKTLKTFIIGDDDTQEFVI